MRNEQKKTFCYILWSYQFAPNEFRSLSLMAGRTLIYSHQSGNAIRFFIFFSLGSSIRMYSIEHQQGLSIFCEAVRVVLFTGSLFIGFWGDLLMGSLAF